MTAEELRELADWAIDNSVAAQPIGRGRWAAYSTTKLLQDEQAGVGIGPWEAMAAFRKQLKK